MAYSTHIGVAKGTISKVYEADYTADVNIVYSNGTAENLLKCPILTPYAHENTGIYFLPEVGDKVWVGFENSSTLRAFVLGSVWESILPAVPPDVKQIRCKTSQIELFLHDPNEEMLFLMNTKSTGMQYLRIGHNGIDIYSEKGDIKVAADSTLNINSQTFMGNAKDNVSIMAAGLSNIFCIQYCEKGLMEKTVSDLAKVISTAWGDNSKNNTKARYDTSSAANQPWYSPKDFKWASVATSAFLFLLPFVPYAGFYAQYLAGHFSGQVTYNAPLITFGGAAHAAVCGVATITAGAITAIKNPIVKMFIKKTIDIHLSNVKLALNDVEIRANENIFAVADKIKVIFQTLTITATNAIRLLAKSKVTINAATGAEFESQGNCKIGALGGNVMQTSTDLLARGGGDVKISGANVNIT